MAAETFEMQRGALMGPRCDHCPGSEADCARNYPCCSDCSHFTEPETDLDLTPDRPTRPQQEPTMTTPTSISSIGSVGGLGELLQRARPITDKAVTRAVKRVDDACAALRAAMTEHEGKAAARRDVERLEAQLAAAKARLRGGRPVTATGSSTRRYEPVDCPKCGTTCGSPMGLAAHQRGNKCTAA